MPQYIYVLLNPSIKDLVKIGRTNRNVDERAAELSAATGVPTPFIVAYESEVIDSVLAEKRIHAELALRGFRVNDRREFFAVPLKVAVDVVTRVVDLLPPSPLSDVVSAAEEPRSESEAVKDLASELLVEGWEALEGSPESGVLQDFGAARRSFEGAAKLGSAHAHFELGKIFEQGVGVSPSISKALEHYHAAAKGGFNVAYSALRSIYLGERDASFKNWTNADVIFGAELKTFDGTVPLLNASLYLYDALDETTRKSGSEDDKFALSSVCGVYVERMLEVEFAYVRQLLLRARQSRLEGVLAQDFAAQCDKAEAAPSALGAFEQHTDRLFEQEMYMQKLLAGIDWDDVAYVKSADPEILDPAEYCFFFDYQRIYPSTFPTSSGEEQPVSAVQLEQPIFFPRTPTLQSEDRLSESVYPEKFVAERRETRVPKESKSFLSRLFRW